MCVFGQRYVEPGIGAMLHVQMGDGKGDVDVGKGSFAIGRLWQFVGALTISKARPLQTLAVIMDMDMVLSHDNPSILTLFNMRLWLVSQRQ